MARAQGDTIVRSRRHRLSKRGASDDGSVQGTPSDCVLQPVTPQALGIGHRGTPSRVPSIRGVPDPFERKTRAASPDRRSAPGTRGAPAWDRRQAPSPRHGHRFRAQAPSRSTTNAMKRDVGSDTQRRWLTSGGTCGARARAPAGGNELCCGASEASDRIRAAACTGQIAYQIPSRGRKRAPRRSGVRSANDSTLRSRSPRSPPVRGQARPGSGSRAPPGSSVHARATSPRPRDAGEAGAGAAAAEQADAMRQELQRYEPCTVHGFLLSRRWLDARPRAAERNRAFGYFCGAARLRSSAMRAPSSARELIPSFR